MVVRDNMVIYIMNYDISSSYIKIYNIYIYTMIFKFRDEMFAFHYIYAHIIVVVIVCSVFGLEKALKWFIIYRIYTHFDRLENNF